MRINISMDERLLSAIDREAEARGETRSAFLANAARARMQKVS
jgi:metal-responsive CopG/Arc/MetJ family transcriptional regulator